MRHGRSWLDLAFVAFLALAGGTLWALAQPPKPAPPAVEPEEESEEEQKARTTAAAFQKALENNPRRGTALDRLYGYHVERGTLDKFVEEYAARTKKDPKDGVAWMIVGLVESQRSRDGAAVVAFQKAAEILTENAMASYYLGQTLVLIGRPDAAVDAFERAIARKPNRNDTLDAYQALGRVHQRAQKTEKALEVWNRLEKQFPDDLRVQEQIATTLVEEGQYEQALPRYEKLAKDTDDKYRQSTLRMDVADLKVKLKKTNDALVDFEKLLNELNPESWLYRDVRRRIEDVFLKNDDLAGLAKYYESWLEKNKTDVEAMARLAKNLASQGKGPEARKWLEKGIEAAPSNKSLRTALIEQLAFEGNFADAAKQYEAMEKNDPGNPDILRDWGKLHMRDTAKPEAERKAAAVAIWKRILDKKANDPVTTSQVAELIRSAGIADEAIALYKKAIELAPNAAQYREYLGEYYHSLKRPEEALATWRPIAEGPNRNAKNLARLGEVYAGFGYRKEAIRVFAEAIQLEKDDYNLIMQFADVLAQENENDEALKQLDLAAKFTSNAEEVEQILAARIKIYQAADKLNDQIDQLSKELAADPNAPASKWLVLARMFEANRQLDKAVESIASAEAKDPKSLAVLTAAARIHEAGGNMLASAEANRKLASLDRRYRTEYLQQVAVLEQRLGKRDDALKTAKDVLASAPGNPDVYKWYSEMCFQLGDAEEALEALRRSVRANPSDPQGLITLANAMAERVRTGEAIELFWRAFDKTTELEGKLGVIERLTQLYLEQNQFDKLMERLERERREQEKNRELTMCIAQAFQSAGDNGSARLQLERLLTENTRDTNLLAQLSGLSEVDGDLPSALKYQRQLAAAAPQNFDAQVRLAQLLLKSGEGDEAADVWVKSVAEMNEPHRNLQSIDMLISSGKPESAMAILSRMLAKTPGNWELLYREGAVLAAQGKKADAANRFRSILAQKLADDDLGEVLQHEMKLATKKKDDKKGTKPTGPVAPVVGMRNRASNILRPPLQRRMEGVWEIRSATGIEPREYYRGQTPTFYTPKDFGEARMAALGWLFEFARDVSDGQEKFIAEMRKERSAANASVRALWDWHYLQALRYDNKDTFETAKALAKASNDPSAQYVFVTSVGMRAEAMRAQRYSRSGTPEDRTPPLPDDQLKYLLDTFKKLKQIKPEWVTPEVSGSVLLELKRAKKVDEEKAMYAEILANATNVDRVASALAVAVERDDLETLMVLFKRLEQYQGVAKSQAGLAQLATRQNVYQIQTLMGKRLEAKKYDDGLKLLDYYLGTVRKQNLAAPKSASGGSARRFRSGGGMHVYIAIGGNQYGQSKQLTYPTPNEYYDEASIGLLYNAFFHYQKADLLTDLFAHFQKNLAAAPDGAEKQYLHLALGYLHWWNEEKDEALDQLTAAAQVGPNDHRLTMEIAGLREQNNEIAVALAMVDSINPTDHQVMQQREETALRLAERTGNIERARQAAERLFGLRLDTDKQLDLAAKMHRLGMHQLAETVLARAQRQAGNKTAILARLMNQYQSQGQNDQAVQIARQILRKPAAVSTSGGRYGGDEGDGYRSQAMGILARSGQLKELIDRAEAQLKTAPKSIQVHQTLLGYYQASGDKDKQKASLLKLVELKPDDANLKFTAGQKLSQWGDRDEALKLYSAALKKDPSMFQNWYYEIERAFSEAGKYEELVALFDQIDLKKLGNYWNVAQMVSNLLEQDKTREIGMRLFKKGWDAYPQERAYFFSYINRNEIWKMPEIYDYLKQALIPKDGSLMEPWDIIGQIVNYGQNGKVESLLSKMLAIARQQQRLPELGREIDAALAKNPDWLAGQALRAIIDVQTGRKQEGMKAWNALFADKALRIPANARFVMAQEFEYYSGIEELVVKSLEEGFEDFLKEPDGSEYSYSPARRLIWWYEQVGRVDDAKKVLVKLSKTDRSANQNYYSGGYWEYRQIQDGIAIAQDFVRIGDPIEAIRVYQDLLSNRERIQIASTYYGGGDQFSRQIDQGMKAALKALKPEILPAAVGLMLTPAKITETNKSAIDLMLSVDARNLEKMALTSVFATSAQSLAKNPAARAAAQTKAKELVATAPKDVSAHVAAAIVAFTDDNPTTARDAVAALAKLVGGTPLEPLPKTGKANSRQRAEALLQVSLWLIARECLKKDDLRAAGAPLAERALEAAKRQNDPKYAMALLREWGQIELDRKDQKGAEAKWTELLELNLPKPAIRSAQAPASTPVSPVPVPASGATPAPPPSNEPQARIDDGRPTYFTQVAGLFAPPAAASKSPSTAITPKNGVPVLTTDQFQQAYDVANLAADKKLGALSLKAMREALKGGPPVEGKVDQNRRGGGSYHQVTVGGVQYLVERGYEGPISVDSALLNLVTKWKKLGVASGDMYDVIAMAVFPESRPAEMFLSADVRRAGMVYTMLSGSSAWSVASNPPPEVFGGSGGDRGLAGLLSQLAIDAGKVDDLKKKIESREKQPLGEMPAKFLSFTFALKANDEAKATEILKALGDRAAKDSSSATLDMVSKLCQIALDRPTLAPVAEPILQKVAMNYAIAKNFAAASELAEKIVAHHVKRGDKKQAIALMKTMETTAKTFMTPDQNFHERMGHWYLKAGSVEDSLKSYAIAADMASTDGADASRRSRRVEPQMGNFVNLVQHLLELPADKRYAALKGWTLPGEKRKTLRYSIGMIPDAMPPPAFVKLPPLERGRYVSTMLLLVDAAKEAGKLDELLAEADKLAQAKIENADAFRVLAYLRIGKGKAIEADIKAYSEAAVKRMTETRPNDQLRSRYDSSDRQTVPFHPTELLFAQLCCADPAFALHGEKLFRPMEDRTRAAYDLIGYSQVREAMSKHSVAARKVPAAFDDALPGRWQSITPASRWFAHDGALGVAWSRGESQAIFGIPLAGTFEFSVEVWQGGWSESHGGYASVIYQPNRDNVATQIYPVGKAGLDQIAKPKPKVMNVDAYNLLTIRVEPKKVTCLWNGEVFFEDTDPVAIGPWLLLHGGDGRKPVFRNPKLTGKPEVLESVKLTNGNDLDGWFALYANGSMPARLTKREFDRTGKILDQYGNEVEQPERQEPVYDWHAKDGEILGRKSESAESRNIASNLAYFRPLRVGDSVAYEFFHEPGKTHVHPSIGRFVFLVDADGVKQHWIVAGEDWTGLKPDNAVPLAGAGKPMFKAKDWNAGKLTRTAAGAKLEINGAVVFDGPLDADTDWRFGFFHFRDQTAVRVRNVVLAGDWPKTIALDDVAFVTKAPSVEIARTRRKEIGDKYYSGNPGEILKATAKLPPTERYAALAAAVLPGPTQPSFEMSGVVLPQDVLGIVDRAEQPAGRRVFLGSKFEAPCLALADVAKQLNKLDELARRVQEATGPDVDAAFRRDQKAMLTIVRAAQGNDAEAAALLKELLPIAKSMPGDERGENRWGLYCAATAAVNRPALLKAASDLAEEFTKNFRQNKPFDGREPWGRIYQILRTRAVMLQKPDGSERFGSDDRLSAWISVPGFDSWSRAQGWNAAHWSIKDKVFVHQPGHREDYLILKTPIRGDFELTCELRIAGYAEADICYGGYRFRLNYDQKWYKFHPSVRDDGRQVTILPPLKKIENNKYPFKMTVKDGVMAVFVDGRKVHEERIGTNVDPWLALATMHHCTAEIFNLKITPGANATVPDKIDLIASENLAFWRPYLGPIWGKRGEEIFQDGAKPEPRPDGKPHERTFPENAIYYQRPLAEDSSVEYEFYYQADKAMAYPALDRLCVMLEPDGAKLHWLTDSWHDKSGVKFDNLTETKGPKVPLKDRQWNKAKLSVKGDTLIVEVNGEKVFERGIESTNQRTFGLFHYSDRTDARVRNVYLSGSWSKTLPTTEQLFEVKK